MMKLKFGILCFGLLRAACVLAAEPKGPIQPTQVSFIAAPLKPTTLPETDQSVLLGQSNYYALGGGKGDAQTPWYEPVEAGAFRVANGRRTFNRPIFQFRNVVFTGDQPIFQLKSFGGSYVMPYWPNPGKKPADVVFGTLKLGVVGSEGKVLWLESLPGTETIFWPGYTDYRINGPDQTWKARIRVAPTPRGHGLVCRVEFEGTPQRLVWSYGGVAFNARNPLINTVEIGDREARITEPADLANGLVLAGWDAEGKGESVADKQYGSRALFTAARPQGLYHIVAHWGITRIDPELEAMVGKRLAENPAAQWWPESLAELKRLWRERTIAPVMEPEKAFAATLADPAAALADTVAHWDKRREEFVVKTPDAKFNALINYARAASDYHRDGPGYFLGFGYASYMHISVGWYGKEWAGDHAANAMNLRTYALLQIKDNPNQKERIVSNSSVQTPKGGGIGWGNWKFDAWMQENNTPYWVDQVWQHYRWSGDKQFLKEMWPHLLRAVEWETTYNDPDGDGLFRSYYDYWNSDSGGKGPKGVAPTATGFAMLMAAAQVAHELGEVEMEKHYLQLAGKSRTAAQRELWNEKAGLMGSIGNDNIWQGHPNHWDEYYGVQFGLMTRDQGRRAMRWIESHYGFQGDRPEVRLLMNSDWWPHRWSNHWVPVGDTLLAAMAGMNCGDEDLWWPYVQTAVGSAFRSNFPGVNFAISNTGAGGGDWEDVDADDPHMHLAVRGLFGVEPALHQGRLSICPAFPKTWTQASIKTPDLEYEWQRQGAHATFRIKTAKPLVKEVRANLTGKAFLTPAETLSVVTVDYGPAVPPPGKPTHSPTLLAERDLPPKPIPLTATEKQRLRCLDLSASYNLAWEGMAETKFLFDFEDKPKPIREWWHTPGLAAVAMPAEVESADGVKYRLSGRAKGEAGKKNLLAMASWEPYPLPGGARISVGRKCERLYLLLQSYTTPSRSYIPNGEVELFYADGTSKRLQLIPPFNLDCYYQHFSREGVAVPLGELEWPKGWTPVSKETSLAHADSLPIACDPDRELRAVEIRATCSHAVIAVAGITLLESAKK